MPSRHALVFVVVCACMTLPHAARASDEAAASEPLPDRDAVILFEDFESPDYKETWPVFWGEPAGAGTVSSPPEHVFAGERSVYLQSRQGEHRAEGSGEYVPEQPIDDVAFARLWLRLDDKFKMGTSTQLKLFGVKGGATIEEAYGGAGKRAEGDDKLSVRVALNNARVLHLYVYHPDQLNRYGDRFHRRGFFRAPKLRPGQWTCLELMVKNNTPGELDGELRLWRDDEPMIHVKKIRFRDTDAIKIRRFTIENYFGGSGSKNASPKDQRLLVDDYVISRERIGCHESPPTDSD